MNNQAGKGSKPRPVNKKKFDDNFDDIRWSNKPQISSQNKGKKTTYKY